MFAHLTFKYIYFIQTCALSIMWENEMAAAPLRAQAFSFYTVSCSATVSVLSSYFSHSLWIESLPITMLHICKIFQWMYRQVQMHRLSVHIISQHLYEHYGSMLRICMMIVYAQTFRCATEVRVKVNWNSMGLYRSLCCANSKKFFY